MSSEEKDCRNKRQIPSIIQQFKQFVLQYICGSFWFMQEPKEGFLLALLSPEPNPCAHRHTKMLAWPMLTTGLSKGSFHQSTSALGAGSPNHQGVFLWPNALLASGSPAPLRSLGLGQSTPSWLWPMVHV